MTRTFVIAEAGVNHNGSIEIAKKLIDAARAAGADAIKFQTFNADRLVTAYAAKADYQKATTSAGESQLEMIRKLELNRTQHHELVRHCASAGIEFMSTAFDQPSVDLLRELDIRIWKIPSGEITNLPYLRTIGSLGKPVILSTGMATIGEVEAALLALEKAGTTRDRVTVLHCTTEYPAPLDEVNLRAMVTMGHAFGVEYGYSDHTRGIAVPIAAVSLGATVIEKHLTLDRGMAGPDHRASLEPGEFTEMVNGIRDVGAALGDGIKRPIGSEIPNIPIARKSIVAARAIARGERFTEENLTVKRPGTGISPMEWDRVIGCTAGRDYSRDEAITWM